MMISRSNCWNFSAGPATLPTTVLEQAQSELLNWQGCGLSVLEMSHRSQEFQYIAQETEANFRKLLTIPKNYHVLFMQGGASSQFSMVPMNLSSPQGQVDYILSGSWANKAIKEASRFCQPSIAAHYHKMPIALPDIKDWQLNPKADYLHITMNETIEGLQLKQLPDINTPLVADMSSCLASTPIDVNKFSLIYAGAQKNLGIAGLTLVIIRDDLLSTKHPQLPSMYHYATQVEHSSFYNTPPTFAWYMTGLVFQQWLADGGLTAISVRNKEKSSLLYDFIDKHPFYHNPVQVDQRSDMNVIFTLADKSKETDFIQQADKLGLKGLKGHRLLGGMRASIYNAMPIAGIYALLNFMEDFAKQYAY